MIHLESLICHSCEMKRTWKLFDNTDRRAIVGSCGHSICTECSNPERDCPLCGRAKAFASGTINYQVLHLLEYYMNNVFDVFRKWWDTLGTGIGVCSKCMSRKPLRLCLTCKKARNWRYLDMKCYVLCEECAEQKKMKREGNHHCDSTCIKEKLEGVPDIKCYKCSAITVNPHVCSTCFHIFTDRFSADPFSLCADCILDHHSGHETSKYTENYSIRFNTVRIVEDLLLQKLSSTEKEDEKKCKVRQMRMSKTGREVLYRAGTHYPLWTEEDCTDPKLLGRPKIPKDYFQNVLSSLEQQFDFLQKMTEPCPCVAVWEDVKRLNIFDVYGNPPHFLAMVNTPDLEKVLDQCPLELAENQELKEQLMEVIERGEVLTEPHEKIFRYHGLQTF